MVAESSWSRPRLALWTGLVTLIAGLNYYARFTESSTGSQQTRDEVYRWPTFVLVGVAFGLAHGLLEALIVLIPFGIVLAYVRDRTGSVFPGMVVHALFNGVALAYSVLG